MKFMKNSVKRAKIKGFVFQKWLSIFRNQGSKWNELLQAKAMSSLHTAIFNERIYQIQVFLTVGMKVDTKDDLGRTPLMIACFMTNKRRRETVCQLLLDHGADVKLRDKFERTILMYACATRNEFLLDQLLLYTDDDLNWVDLDGNTCLMYAAIEGDVKIMKKLLEPFITYGVDLDVCNRQGLTAYLLALKNGNTDCAKILQNKGASFQIFDTEYYWNGERWLDLHYTLRYKRESSQYRGSMRTKSQASLMKNNSKSESPRKPFSAPHTTSRKLNDISQNQTKIRKEKKIRGKKVTSASVDLDVIAIRDNHYTVQQNYWEKGATKRKPRKNNVEETILREEIVKSYAHDDVVATSYKTQNEPIGDYNVIARPQTRLSVRSEKISQTGKPDYGEIVSISKRPSNRGQQEQLIKIFNAYSINQVPIPPAIPEKAVRMKPLKLNAFIRRASVDKPRNRCSLIVRTKARDARYDIKAMSALKLATHEK